jgi:hypothetical protein
MNNSAHDNLTELLNRFMDESAARGVQEDIEAADRILEAHPAPLPAPGTVATIKALTIAAAVHRRRRIRVFRGAVAAAAAVILTVLIGQYGRAPVPGPSVNLASIFPAAVWESHDLGGDDLDLVYFTSEVRQIEAQMRALEAGETGGRPGRTVEEIEMELMRIETEFWKG